MFLKTKLLQLNFGPASYRFIIHGLFMDLGTIYPTNAELDLQFSHTYIGPEVEQQLGKTYAQLARGRDDYNHHFLVPRASGSMVPEEVTMWHTANEELRGVLYHDAERVGKY